MADIRIKGRMVNAIRISLDTNDHDAIRQQLSPKHYKKHFHLALWQSLKVSVEQELIALDPTVNQSAMYSLWLLLEGILGEIRPAPFSSRVLPPDRTVSKRLKPPKNKWLKSNQNLQR